MSDKIIFACHADQVEKNINSLNNALCNGDFDEFIKITELEALTLHAMMMTSDPYYLLIKPNTLNILYSLRPTLLSV